MPSSTLVVNLLTLLYVLQYRNNHSHMEPKKLDTPPESYQDPSERAGAEDKLHIVEDLKTGPPSPEQVFLEEQQKEIDKLFNSVAELNTAKEVQTKLQEIYDRGAATEQASLLSLLSSVLSRLQAMPSDAYQENIKGINNFIMAQEDVISSSPDPSSGIDKEINEELPLTSRGRVTQVNIKAHKPQLDVLPSPSSVPQEDDFFDQGDRNQIGNFGGTFTDQN